MNTLTTHYEACTDLFLGLFAVTEPRREGLQRILETYGSKQAALKALQHAQEALSGDAALLSDCNAKLQAVNAFLENPAQYAHWVLEHPENYYDQLFQIPFQAASIPAAVSPVTDRKVKTQEQADMLLAKARTLLDPSHQPYVEDVTLILSHDYNGYFSQEHRTIMISPDTDEAGALAVIIHELGHALHYTLAKNADVEHRRTITRHGHSSALKEGFAYELLREVADSSGDEELILAAHALISHVFARAEREVNAFRDKDLAAIDEFLAAPAYRSAYVHGILAVRKLREHMSYEAIAKYGLTSLKNIELPTPTTP